MLVLVGLGNPDRQYFNTYHNMGYRFLDYFAETHNLEFTQNKYNAFCSSGMIDGEKVILLKPTTYMNISGKCVADVVRKLKLPLDRVMVIFDDIDIPVGTIRTRLEGSAGTHNGMRNIVSMVGSTKFPRIKVGIGKEIKGDLADYVLSKITDDDDKLIKSRYNEMDNAILEYIKKGTWERNINQ